MIDLNRRMHRANFSVHPDVDRPELYAFPRVYRHPISIERKVSSDAIVVVACCVIGVALVAAAAMGLI